MVHENQRKPAPQKPNLREKKNGDKPIFTAFN